jgi:hypothetical protein
MEILGAILTILGLCLFETVSSVDNAIINADILTKMSQRARKWFLFWGILFAVFIVRGLLPLLIIWVANPQIGLYGAFTATFSEDPMVVEAMEQSAPVLLIGGGVFLVFLFFHWLFLEPKNYGMWGEKFISSQGIWFFAVVSVLLSIIVWFAIQINPIMAFGAVVGSTAFFITHGFKQNAELREKELMSGASNLSDMSKLMYLEVIDLTFSIDGVLGAFAFTLAVPLILIGNGLGAIVVRELTIRGIKEVRKYAYLKNGAMYSIFFLGSIMVLDGFGFEIPAWFSPIITFAIVGYFYWKSLKKLNGDSAAPAPLPS